MADTPDIRQMDMQELLGFVAALEAKYRAWGAHSLAYTIAPGRPQPRRVDLLKLRASLQRCVAELDRLLGEGDEQ